MVVVFLDARRFVSCDPGTVASRGAVSGASVKANPKVRAGSNDPPQDSLVRRRLTCASVNRPPADRTLSFI